MLDNSHFHCLSGSYLEALADELEARDADGRLDVELGEGMLTVTLPDKRQYVVSRHEASKQVWLSSPVSGGLHFSYDEEDSAWELPDGRRLCHILADELHQATGLHFNFDA